VPLFPSIEEVFTDNNSKYLLKTVTVFAKLFIQALLIYFLALPSLDAIL
jgi:hypothetical protein